MKKLTYIILLIFLMSCGSKKTTTSNTSVLTTKSEKEYVSMPIKTDYSIRLECDSLGNVKPVNYLKSSGVNQASVGVKNNYLNVRLLTGQSTYKSLKTTSDKSIEDKEEVVKYKVSPWHWFFHLVAGVIIFILVKISSLNPMTWIKKLKFW